MAERKAVKYGQVQIIQGVICDGYILDDGTPVLSERGTADLLGMRQMALYRMTTNWPPKIIEPLIDKDLSMTTNLVKVVAPNSPYKNRKIIVYGSSIIETLIRGYSLAFANRSLKTSQIHIGERCVILACALIRTALDTAIKEACGYTPNIQETAQQHCNNLINLIKEAGFVSSVSDEIATKKDIAKFLKVPESTLTSFLRKYHTDIKPVKLDNAAIKAIGSRAKRMFGYWMEDVAKIVLEMDSEITVQLKNKMFGQLGNFANMQSKSEVQWRIALARVFENFDLNSYYSEIKQ